MSTPNVGVIITTYMGSNRPGRTFEPTGAGSRQQTASQCAAVREVDMLSLFKEAVVSIGASSDRELAHYGLLG